MRRFLAEPTYHVSPTQIETAIEQASSLKHDSKKCDRCRIDGLELLKVCLCDDCGKCERCGSAGDTYTRELCDKLETSFLTDLRHTVLELEQTTPFAPGISPKSNQWKDSPNLAMITMYDHDLSERQVVYRLCGKRQKSGTSLASAYSYRAR